MVRNYNCGALTAKNKGEEVKLRGWVHRIRDHGGKKFIDLRDRKGITQLVFFPEFTSGFKSAQDITVESVLGVKGVVKKRPRGNVNIGMVTGGIEVHVSSFEVYSKAERLPFVLDEGKMQKVGEDTRLRYRYLDLRRESMRDNIIKRHRFVRACRTFLDEREFLDIETPFLTKSTPEGARDFIVPSRVFKGKVYALPQSPQLFKQLLMISGFERYYQFVRCFRDEDTRKDRQLEFTQLDIEVSFMEQKEFLELMSELIINAVKETYGIKIDKPEYLTYSEAMEKYGTDRPDLRFKLEIEDFTSKLKNSEFRIFANAVKEKKRVKGIFLDKVLSKKDLRLLENFVKKIGLKGFVSIIRGRDNKIQSIIPEKESKRLLKKKGTLVLFAGAPQELLGEIRIFIAQNFGLVKKGFKLAWIVDMPLFRYSEEEKRVVSEHHPFTMPKSGPSALLKAKPSEILKMKADAYDLVLNGFEIAGGSRRIHIPEVQRKVFKILKLTEKEVEERFGWFLEAFKYGAPPHRGIAFGLDRIIMVFQDRPTIREVIAFPKNKSGFDPLTGAPAEPTEEQREGLRL